MSEFTFRKDNLFINPYSGPRIITPDSLNEADRKVPSALVLPPGKFFFGYKFIPFDAEKAVKKQNTPKAAAPTSFSGEGTTLKRRLPVNTPPNPDGRSSSSAPSAIRDDQDQQADPWSKLGGGNILRAPKKEADQAVPQREVIDATMLDEDDFEFGEDEGEYDNIIEIDSD